MKRYVFWLAAALAPGVCGAVTVPWSEDFNTSATVSAFTIIDANADGEKWEYNSDLQCMRIRFNTSRPMDDWLITPPMQLKAGRTYRFSVDGRRYGLGTERLEVKAGNAASAQAMTIEVVPRTSVKTEKYSTFTGEFTVPVTGDWYIGVHGCSDADQLYLEVDNLRLVSGVEQASPAAVTDLTFAPDANGYLRARISYSLPTVCVDGSALTRIDKTEILLDGSVIATQTDGTPGAHQEYALDPAPAGNHECTVVVYADDERGVETSASTFIGQKTPAQVTGFKAEEIENGLVRLTWDVPRDIEGKSLNPDLITYRVVQNVPFQESLFTEEDIEGAGAIVGCSYTHRAINPGEGQLYTSYGVYATTSGGTSKCVKLPLFPVGSAYPAPFAESFADGEKHSLMRSETVNYAQIAGSWDVYADGALDAISSQDADGGFVVMSGYAPGDCARLYSGKISLESLASPALSMYVYRDPSQYDNNELELYVNKESAGFSFKTSLRPGDLSAEGWNKVMVPLSDCAGKTVQFALQGTVGNHTVTAVDNIRIANQYSHDLTALSLTGPTAVTCGHDFMLTASVYNSGSAAAGEHTLVLLRDGQMVDSFTASSLASGATEVHTFPCHAGILNCGETHYSLRVDYADEMEPSDNNSDLLTVNVLTPPHPAPQSLDANQVYGNVSLQWTAPDMTRLIPDPVCDDFESYAPFAQEGIGEWIMVDADGYQNGKLSDITFPGINDNVEGGQHSSFWILDYEHEGLNSTFSPYSGTRCLAQIFNYGDLPCDDWAISPELCGTEQTISLFARSYSSYPSFAETMQILISDSDTELDSFRAVATETVPSSWTEYRYTLPAGTRRFAIRCLSEGCYMLLVDDVTFVPAHGTSTAILEGYRLYRDGEPLSVCDTSTLAASDRPGDGLHTYAVTAVYDRGESAAVLADVDVTLSGVNELSDAWRVMADHGSLTVRGAAGPVEIYTPQGVCTVRMDGDSTITLAPGVYIVTDGRNRCKVTVR